MTTAQRFQRPLGSLVVMALLLSALGIARTLATDTDNCFNDSGVTKGTVLLDAVHGGDDPGTSNWHRLIRPCSLSRRNFKYCRANKRPAAESFQQRPGTSPGTAPSKPGPKR